MRSKITTTDVVCNVDVEKTLEAWRYTYILTYRSNITEYIDYGPV